VGTGGKGVLRGEMGLGLLEVVLDHDEAPWRLIAAPERPASTSMLGERRPSIIGHFDI
jgi:hypothetical protein